MCVEDVLLSARDVLSWVLKRCLSVRESKYNRLACPNPQLFARIDRLHEVCSIRFTFRSALNDVTRTWSIPQASIIVPSMAGDAILPAKDLPSIQTVLYQKVSEDRNRVDVGIALYLRSFENLRKCVTMPSWGLSAQEHENDDTPPSRHLAVRHHFDDGFERYLREMRRTTKFLRRRQG